MSIPPFFDSLLRAAGPSGRETAPARVWREGCDEWASAVGSDVVGSSWARVDGTAEGKSLIVVGHIDEIGIHVTHIEDSGMLRFGEVGGWDPIVLVGQRVRLTTREGELIGVVARKPIHLLKGDERSKMPEIRDLHLDIGAKDGDEARGLVRIGDAGVIDVEPIELRHDRIVSRALDNRVGCFVAAEAARYVAAAGGAPGSVTAMAVVQEEETFGGSRTSAYSQNPDVAIAVDVTFSTDQPGVELGQMTKHELGTGPVVARGSSLHPEVFELLYDAGKAEDIPFTVESVGRSTGTDADAIHISRAGVPTGLISIPLRYMHSPVELVSLADIDNAARLIAAFARRLEPSVSFER
jgi:endoglucanase